MKLQSALKLVYPSQCLTCGIAVEEDLSLCGTCWREAYFIHGLTCRSCGVPLPGDDLGEDIQCDDCITTARPWYRGKAALMYRGKGREVVLRLKHGDRTDLARPAGQWMARVAPNLDPNTVVVPVPLHWLRFLKRRYNQAALLAQVVASELNLAYLPDALHRPRATESLDGKNRNERFSTLDGMIVPHSKRGKTLNGRPVLLIDDVMTSGATLATCTEACFAAGAKQVDVLVLARVAKDD